MNLLFSVLMALQLVSALCVGVQRTATLLKPPAAAGAEQAPTPTAIPAQSGDDVRYWWDGQRQQWCCLKNGVLFVWGPSR